MNLSHPKRKWLEAFKTCAPLLVALCIGMLVSGTAVLATPGNCSIFRTWNTGDVLNAPDLTTSFTQVGVTNLNGDCVAGHSASIAEMQTQTDPFPSGVESRPTSLNGELERLRFVLTKLTGWTQWYKYTDPLKLGGAQQTFRGLQLRTHPDADKAPNKVELVTADEIVTDDGSRTGNWGLAGGFAPPVADITQAGVYGGLDTGSRVASTWYETWAIRSSQGNFTVPVPSAASGAAGNVNAGTHSWEMTCVSAAGESLPSAKSNQLNLGSALQVTVTLGICPMEATSRKVYRTVSGDTGNYLFVGTVSDNLTTTFTDNVADGSLGAAAPLTGSFGPARALLLHRAKNYGLDQSQTTGHAGNQNLADTSSESQLAQKFTPAVTGLVERIDVWISATATAPTGQVWLELRPDNVGVPSGTVLATSDRLDASKVNSAGQVNTVFAFRSPVSLTSGTQYWIVLNTNITINGTNFLAWGFNASGTNQFYKWNGSTWTAIATATAAFKEYATQNAAAVTMPTGFDSKAKIGWVFNNSGNALVGFLARDRANQILAPPTVQSGGLTVNVPLFVDLSTVVPPIRLRLRSGGASGAAAQQTLNLGPVPDGYGIVSNAFGAGNIFLTTQAQAGQPTIIGDLISEYQGMYVLSGATTPIFYILEWEW